MTTAGTWPPASAQPPRWWRRPARWRAKPTPLIDDPYAEPLVRAVGIDLFTKLATGELSPADLEDDSDGAPAGVQRMTDNMAVRTKFFDEFFLDATNAGIRQAVILASGLDSRAYRLPWPDGTMVYEIDQPQVIEFKSRTLAELGAAAHRRPARGRRRSARRLAGRAAGGGFRPRPAERLERRGPAGLPAAGGTGPVARHHHRAQRAGQPDRHRKRAHPRARTTRSGSKSACGPCRSAGASTGSIWT